MDRSKDWIEQARGDLEHARHDLQHEFYDWACFSSQQASEKEVKAVLQRQGVETWGRSVAYLLRTLENTTEVDEALIEAANELDKTYITPRYPDALPSGAPRTRYTRTEAERMVG